MSLARIADTWRTTTFRLTLIYGVMFFIGTIVLLVFIYTQAESYFTQQMDQVLKVESSVFNSTSPEQIPVLIAESLELDSRHISLYGLYTKSGDRLSGNLGPLPDVVRNHQQAPGDVIVTHLENPDHHILEVHLLSRTLSDGSRLVVGRFNTHIQEIRHIVLLAFAGAALVVAVVTLAGISISVVPLRRIEQIRQVSELIMHGDIQRRLPVAGINDELDMLAQIINRMLNELERMMLDIKGATDRVAHDLRTPLTRLRAMLNRALQQLPDTAAGKEMLQRSLVETDALLARFRALMRVAELSSLTRRSGFTLTRLQTILQQVEDLYAPLAEERHVTLSLQMPEEESTVYADSNLLFEAVANLVDNAIKFSYPQGKVRITLENRQQGPFIDIMDNGPGISAQEVALITQPFYRGKDTEQVEGYGLGLSIVSAILHLHDFRLGFSSSPNGNHVSVECWKTGMNALASEGAL